MPGPEGYRSSSLRWMTSLMPMCLLACLTPPSMTPHGSFGLASMHAPSYPLREVGPADQTVCMPSNEPVDWSDAVEVVISEHPPANALRDVNLTVLLRGLQTCVRVTGTAVVLE